ncbi:uncharacterized protein [Nicotiana tomentosiformis]|uniref:uncharacterized protein n=1 Tax=Nicotiana tomentosiformis TaxID=4098 RepID=UPI00388CCA9E
MVVAVVAAPPTPLARGGGQAGRGRPRGGGQARFYAFPGRAEVVASYAVITGLRQQVMGETHYSRYSVHPGETKMYHDIREIHWWDRMKQDIAERMLRDVRQVGLEHSSWPNSLGRETFDVILGMDWLSPYHTILDCHAKTMTLAMPGFLQLEWRGTLDCIPSRIISFLKAHRMVEKGCEAYLNFVRDVSTDIPTIESVPVVRDFPNVFPADLPANAAR